MLFTNTPIKRILDTANNQPANIYITPQVSQMMGPGIDTVNWIKVSGTFTAKGGEKHLTIGSFKELPDTLFKHYFTYLFFDDVSLYAIDTIEPYPPFDIWVYPVPSNSRHIRFLRGDGQLLTGFIDVYDPSGRLVFSQPTYDMDVMCDLNLAFLKAGVYLYSIREHDGTIFKSGKIILL
ncbi:MAG TPA: T9SS type A sorting domain-containing protein [Bacteroidales bacterium]|nr:T9SS type A sorting domain-containing protein [Bacteroidales bacterium]HRZ48823.1 T9SS type A sorting domain-containing protein [Bacteroidales bacterium]